MPRITLPTHQLTKHPTGVLALTVSGNETADAFGIRRDAGLQGDGQTFPDKSVGIWPAANAAVVDATLNGDFETNTTGWTNNAAGGVLSRITTDSKFGSACLETVNDGVNPFQGPISSLLTGLTPGNNYTLHFWAKSISGATSVRVLIEWFTAGVVFINSTISDITLTSTWKHFTVVGTAPALGVDAQLVIYNTVASAATYRIDGIQFDNGNIALPFNQANTRAASRIRLTTTGLYTGQQGWAAFRVAPGWGNSNEIGGGSGFPGLLKHSGNGGNDLIFLDYNESTNSVRIVRYASGLTDGAQEQALALTENTYVTVIGKWTPTTVGVSTNGAAFTSGADSKSPSLNTFTDLFEDGNTQNWFGGYAKSVVIGSGILTDPDAKYIHNIFLAGGLPDLYDCPGNATLVWDCRNAVAQVRG